jgi:hypothetical protein
MTKWAMREVELGSIKFKATTLTYAKYKPP